ncbi:2OG-Fe dioxygenase family protein [Nannocystis radixulma]|uniref:2OG-Fe dioxygenase family protein n=1 Tax=Nannocystis radixulma TaxID=2995305 RepID=A0ABT5BNL9_9BACT|nr:2OG-Fe dioxygenase family protein [Nannocystis radixulma]MDC0675687.1 2OG-Fe dioxygenase family protein [Nannocystis radixulma]
MTPLPPPYTDPANVEAAVRRDGYAIVSAPALAAWLPEGLGGLQALQPAWDDLPPDTYLRDGGRYRRRRHSCFIIEGTQVEITPHRAHWQPLEYNALHGGLERWFSPMQPQVTEQPVWSALLRRLGAVCSALAPEVPRWYVEAHQFRIDTTDGIGRPTPEGAHRDGVDFVAVLLVGRQAIKGGETRVFAADGPYGLRFMMSEPWTLLLLDDARVIHETTPIQPLDEAGGHRDTLVLTFRAGGFQGPA